MPQNVRIAEFTDTSIKYEWDTANDAQEYLAYLDSASVPFRVYDTGFLFEGLEQITSHVAQFSVFDGYKEGAKSEAIVQMTRVAKPLLKTPHIDGVTYLLGETISDPNITGLAVYKIDGTWYKNGTVTNGEVKFYATGNLVAGEQYIARVVYGKFNSGTEILGMPQEFECIKARITINPVTTTEKIVSGASEPGMQVRTWQNGVTRTTVPIDADGKYTSTLSTVAIGDVIKAEVKIGSTFSTSIEYTVKE